MELRTKVNIEPSEDKISYNDPVMFIGSCFASSIGARIEMGRMPVMINPAGTVYNPVSVCNTLNNIISEKHYTQDDLSFHDGSWFSFYYSTEFKSDNHLTVIEKINRKSKEALAFLKNTKFLFVTLGTARVYRLKKTGEIKLKEGKSIYFYYPAAIFEIRIEELPLTDKRLLTYWKQDELNRVILTDKKKIL